MLPKWLLKKKYQMRRDILLIYPLYKKSDKTGNYFHLIEYKIILLHICVKDTCVSLNPLICNCNSDYIMS